jgi:hypothetical protein
VQHGEARGERRVVARLRLAVGPLVVGRADVDGQVLDARHWPVAARQVRHRRAYHAGGQVVAHEHPLARQRARVHPAHRLELQQASLAHLGDHEPDFVHVGRQHDLQPRTIPTPAFGRLERNQVAHCVDLDAVDQRLDFPADQVAHCTLMARRPVRAGQALQQFA